MICIKRDGFLDEKCMWVVTLTDGTVVYQDDNRPGIDEPSAWIRLGEHVKKHPGNGIAKMSLVFRDHVEVIAEDKEAFFYSRGILSSMGTDSEFHFHIAGWKDGDDVVTVSYKSPELVVTEKRTRKVSDCKENQLITG